MALDQQRNWTVSMEKNFDKIMRLSRTTDGTKNEAKRDSAIERECQDDATRGVPFAWNRSPVHLPDEIIMQILGYIATDHDSQYTLASCCHLSRQWYSAAVPLLYRRPHLYGSNFDPFVRAICPSINLHVRESPLAELVRVLDMGSLVHQGSKSVTARLLGRTKGSLEGFIAPQASFAMNCFPALSKCRRLRLLDLSLVSESPPLLELFKSVRHLEKLESFRFPRSAGFGTSVNPASLSWPPQLKDLCLSGGIDSNFIDGMVAFPQTLQALTIEHCPPTKGYQLLRFLRNSVRSLPNLYALKIASCHRLHDNSLDSLMLILPNLRKLSISVDYITSYFFDLRDQMSMYTPEVAVNPSAVVSHRVDADDMKEFMPSLGYHTNSNMPGTRLQILELTNSGRPGVEDKISPIDLLLAVEDHSLFPNLMQVRIAKSLFWQSGENAREAEVLTTALEEMSAARRSRGEIERKDLDIGVFTFEG